MSKKRAILGPDGKPLDVAQYRPKPAPAAVTPGTGYGHVISFNTTAEPRAMSDDVTGYIGRLMKSMFVSNSVTFTIGTDDKRTLRDAVAEQVAAIHADLDMPAAPPEMPPPPPEQTDTYAVAFDSARRRCQHPNSASTTHAKRERQCMDCGRYFTRKEWYE